MMLLEEMPDAERVKRGNVLFKTRVRDIEDTMAQLVHDDEQVIAAAAVQVVERREMWSLADDLEHVLAQRDPRDWAVFEAASWALAARRLTPERRRALWLEPLPAVELADRLRRIQLFNFASVNELFRIAGLGRQVRHETGRVLYEKGRAPESLQFLLDGRVTVEDGPGGTERSTHPRCSHSTTCSKAAQSAPRFAPQTRPSACRSPPRNFCRSCRRTLRSARGSSAC